MNKFNQMYEKCLAGIGAGETLETLSKKHQISIERLSKELRMGIEVEHEHTGCKDMAKKIAMDHLSEDPIYYTKLKKMEGK